MAFGRVAVERVQGVVDPRDVRHDDLCVFAGDPPRAETAHLTPAGRTTRRALRQCAALPVRRAASVDEQRALLGAVHADVNRHRVVGEQLLDFFGPLHQTEVARIEILFVAEVVGLLDAVDAVEVEVEDGASAGRVVLVDQREGGAGDRVGGTQTVEDRADEGRLAGTQKTGNNINLYHNNFYISFIHFVHPSDDILPRLYNLILIL